MDFKGEVRQQRRLTYDSPQPAAVFAFLADEVAAITATLTEAEVKRICGIGVAAPFEMWNWQGLVDTATAHFAAVNDAPAACRAEHIYGRGKAYRDYAYFFVGAFVGGGIVLNHSVFEGRQGNAGALGSLRSIGPNGESMQLVDTASIHLLERRLHEVDLDPAVIWQSPQNWSGIERYVEPWLGQTAQELAKASLSTCSVIDFEAILIDGGFPPEIRTQLVERVARYIVNQDTRGLIPPVIAEGTIGGNARAIGAACGPILAQYLLNTNAGLAVA